MKRSPVIRELQPLWKTDFRPAQRGRTSWARLVGAITNPDLITVIFICTIGLLITVNMIIRFPNFGAAMEQLEQFP